MNKTDLSKAVSDARAFIEAAKKVEFFQSGHAHSGRASGTIIRRSMDLTRSLTDLRNPWRKNQ